MFHTISDFIELWKAEAEKTEKIFKALTDESLSIQLIPGVRTLGKIAMHILESPPEMLGHTGLKVEGPTPNQPVENVAQLVKWLHQVTESASHQIQTHWQNKTLHQTDNMYGEQWTRSETLCALLFHTIHHRGQMTVLMRAAGLLVPGIYGPAREEWAAFGMPAQE